MNPKFPSDTDHKAAPQWNRPSTMVMLFGLPWAIVLTGCPGDDTGSGNMGTTAQDTGTTAQDPDATAQDTGTTAQDTDTTGTPTGSLDSSSSGTTGSQRCNAEADAAAWLDLPAYEQLAAIETGDLCCADLVQAYLDRIEADPDDINATIATDPNAISVAASLDDPVASGSLRCLVVAVKDNIDTAGMANTAGSLAMTDNIIEADAPAVAGLRDVGALVLSKANLSEWANFRGYSSTSGWSSLGGQTRNGVAPDYNPCGSSSGSAAAVAAGHAAVAIGTETAGSITCPSSVNGVVGFKPTVGLVSRAGIIPISESHDTAGPITRTVRDAALMMEVISGPDPDDPATSEIPEDFDYGFGAALDMATVDGMRLGTSSAFVQVFSEEQAMLYDTELDRLERAGAVIVEIDLPSGAVFGAPFTTVLTTEFKAGLNAYLAAHAQPGVPQSLTELIEFNAANAAEVMPHFGQEWFIVSEATAGLRDPDYLADRDFVRQQAGPLGLLAVLDGDDLDAIVLPSAGPAWMTTYATGDQPTAPNASFLPAAARYPHLTVPMGQAEGRPVGISFIGRAWEDREILAIGHAYEQLP